ncbi:TadE family protein [Streptomyces sp. NPDC055990]|uniref:TadE family protein n=1 Tax=Streptomyces sp. NPDC055990 TaxID=3345672 RepID=UPI0035DA4227
MNRTAAVIQRWAATAQARLRAQGDRGESSIQMAIVFPFVILLTITAVQVGMQYYARNIALTAAREGVSAGRVHQASPGEGAARARETLGRIAGDSLRGAGVSTAGSSGETMKVTVTGRAVSLVPGIPGLLISQSATGARERWTTP